MRLTFVFLFAFTTLILSQKLSGRKVQEPLSRSDVFFELISLPDDSLNTLFFYKIPYDKSVFVKKNNLYNSEVTVNLEIRDEEKNVIVRSTQTKSVLTTSFEETNSSHKFIQGVFRIKLALGKYLFYPTIEFQNSSRIINYPEITADINLEKNILKPIICRSIKGPSDYFVYENFSGNIPFTKKHFDLLIPYNQSLEYPVEIKISQNNKTVIFTVINDSRYKFSIAESDSEIIFVEDDKGTNFFVVKNINDKLYEGKCDVEISNGKSKELFSMNVRWFDKPNSLNDIENSIDILKLIENKAKVDSLLDEDEENFSWILFDYWKMFDPDTSTTFNEVMTEFYSRVDYADKNFSVFNKKKGSTTDRGIVYIKYGEPDEIIRNFAEIDATSERWIYKKLKLRFNFFDNTGTGNFTLKN
ncbi:MAG: hypothetical protein Fur0015_06480 [Ignavibacteriales bacterium]